MKECYTLVLPSGRLAICDLHADLSGDPLLWRIARINTPWKERNEGYGTRLLRLVTTIADEQGIALTLEPLATGDGQGGLNGRQLVDWYIKHGFVPQSDGTMLRLPNVRKVA